MLHRLFLTVLLLCAGTAQAAFTHYADKFTVTDALMEQELVGETFIWRSGGRDDALGLVALNTPELSSVGVAFDSTFLTFEAAAGYAIVGFTQTYELSFSGGSYLVQGGELGADWGADLQPGDLWVASGRFETSVGSHIDFGGPAGSELMVSRTTTGSQFNTDLSLFVRGLQEFCLPGADPMDCAMGVGTHRVQAGLALLSISITPLVVAIPEPGTYALMVLGLGALAAKTRRRWLSRQG